MKIHEPRLPRLAPVEALPDGALRDHASVAELAASNLSLAGQSAAGVVFEQARFRNVDFSRTRLAGSRWIDVRFEACDLSGIEWEKASLRRVALVDCRLTGSRLLEASIQDVTFAACHAELSLWWSSVFKAARFDACLLREASFYEADLTGVVFRACDLSQADLRGAKLSGSDLRWSTIGGLQVGPQELRGAIFDPAQAAAVAGLLGVVIRPHDDDSPPGA